MNEALTLVLTLLAGGLLGAVFFGGLSWTVSKGVSSKHPVPWFLGSMVLRTGIALAGFYFIAGGHWPRLLMCLLGFIMARLVVMWLTRPSGEKQTSQVQEAGRAH